jgi:predicted trehalose synthase
MPIDPGRDWLAAGITGLQRQREWDAVATTQGDGTPGDEVEFVALADGTLVLESGGGADPAPFATALGESIATPYRALAVRRPDVWAVGAVAIDVERLDPDPRGTNLTLTWNGAELELSIDELPASPTQAPALERIASARVDGAYAAHAHRLRGDLWELSVLPL